MQNLDSDALFCVFRKLNARSLLHCATVCNSWTRVIEEDDSLWQAAVGRAYGVSIGTKLVDVCRLVDTWKDMLRVCERSLYRTAIGLVAARRAYRFRDMFLPDPDGATIRPNTVRSVPHDHYDMDFNPDVLGVEVASSSDTNTSEYSATFSLSRAVFPVSTISNNPCTLSSQCVLTGPETARGWTRIGYPFCNRVRDGAYCTSRGADKNVVIDLKLSRPAIVTGVSIVNPTDPFDPNRLGFHNPVRDAVVYVAMTKEGLTPLADGAHNFPRTSDGALDLRVGGKGARLRHVGKDLAHRQDARDPLALIEFDEYESSATQVIAFCPPTLARWVRIVLLSQHSLQGAAPDNFDVAGFLVYGTPLLMSVDQAIEARRRCVGGELLHVGGVTELLGEESDDEESDDEESDGEESGGEENDGEENDGEESDASDADGGE
jgi:hypothetical protein